MANALRAMATHFGVTLDEPLTINSNGEFRLVARHPDGRQPIEGAGAFGEAFTALLNRHRPRTGTVPGTLCSSNGWCYINHFDAESVVRDSAMTDEPLSI